MTEVLFLRCTYDGSETQEDPWVQSHPRVQSRLMLGGFLASLCTPGPSNANGRFLLSAEYFALLISRAVGYLRGQAFPSPFPHFRRFCLGSIIRPYRYTFVMPLIKGMVETVNFTSKMPFTDTQTI